MTRPFLRHGILLATCIFIAACAVWTSNAFAQNLPGSADPGRISPLDAEQYLKRNLETVAPEARPAPPPILEPILPSEGFLLQDVFFTGNTIFSADILRQQVARYLQQSVDMTTLKNIATMIEQYYRSRGYILCRVILPAQDVQKGFVRFEVIEGYISHVFVDGEVNLVQQSDWFDILQTTVNKIEDMGPLHGPTLESYMLTLNDLPGIVARSVLEPLPQAEAQNAPGAIGLRLNIAKEPLLSGELSLDNSGSRLNGPELATGRAQFSGLLNAFDELTIMGQSTVFSDEQKYFSLSYSLPVSDIGTTAKIYSSLSKSRPGSSIENLEIEGASETYGFQLTQSFWRSRSLQWRGSVGLEIKNSQTDILDTLLYDDKIRVAQLSNYVAYADDWDGVNISNITLRQGLDILGSRETGSDFLSRAEGHSDFTSISVDFLRRQNMFEDWEALLSFSGQYAFSPLLSSEEFGYGGSSYGRAYDPSEITGDSGIATSIEIRYLGLPTLLDLFFQPFAFYDFGKVWNRDDDGETISAVSAGLGVNISHSSGMSGYLTAAWPLTRPADNPPGYANGSSPRYLAGIKAIF